jgi:hypothetical protein
MAFATPGAEWIELNRTPGYHLLLHLTFALFGVGAGGILILHERSRDRELSDYSPGPRAGSPVPWIGAAVGLLYAIEPWSLALANYALTETATVFFVVLAVALVVGLRRATVPAGGGESARRSPPLPDASGSPGDDPVLRGGVADRGVRRRRAPPGDPDWCARGATFLACSAPWLAYNAARGVRASSAPPGRCSGTASRCAVCSNETHPLDPATRSARGSLPVVRPSPIGRSTR